MKTLHLRLAAWVAAALLCAPSASLAENVIVHIWGTDGSTTANDWIQIPLDDQGFFDAQGTSVTDLWEIDWGLNGDADPVVNSNFTVLNTMATTQDFNVTVSVPVFPAITGASVTSGSVGLTVTDNNGNGATLSDRAVNTASIYRSIIDGSTHVTLFDEPYSLVAPAFGSNNASDDFGLPGVTYPGPPALSTIGIQTQFSLSGRDSAGVTATFTLLPVPEPSTWALAGLGLAALVGVARRRS